MNTSDEQHAKALKEALLSLEPSGPEGFEGFLGVILGELTGQSFRLAKSGTQRGRDGDSAFDSGATYFEGKRYKEGLTKNDISVKLFDLANNDASLVDLWILGATCEVSSQTVEDAQIFATNHGFGVAVLDWSSNDMGSLLVATVAAKSKSIAFITKGLTGRPEAGHITTAIEAIEHFAKHVDYPSRLSSLRKALAEDIGLGHAKTLNQAWLRQLFTNKRQARAEFGQQLAPLDPSGPKVLERPERSQLTSAFLGVPDCEIFAIIGEEGVGKSWLAVQSWNLSDPKSLLVVCPADDLNSNDTEDFDDFLIRKLILQMGINITPQATRRWQRRFKAWRANIPASSVRLTVIVDGLNQPLKRNWGHLLDRAAQRLKSIGGCLVLTTRTQHWAHLKNVLVSDYKAITLTDWSIKEVKQILGSRGINFSNTRGEVLESVRNPRLLGIAIELLEAKTIELMDELSIGRLLFEHMRSMQLHGAAQISAPDFADLLKDLASQVLNRANSHETDDLRLFYAVQESQLDAVASSRFFSPVRGFASRYEIKPDGLNLALALYLVGQLEAELRNDRDPRDKLATILEPVSALDETAKVVLLATQIACLDEETRPEIQSALIEIFVSLQNLPNSQFDAFAVLAKSASFAFLQAAEYVNLSQEHISNDDWVLFALINRRDEPAVWEQIVESTKRWLSFYSLAPERRMHRTPRHYSVEKVDEERSRILADINDRVSSLTKEEQTFITTNLIPAPHPKFDGISRFAFYLLAGMPLKDVASYFVCWRFSHALNLSTSAPYTEFEQALHYNRVDWQETRSVLLKSLEALPEEHSSNVGKWTRVGILYGTGDVGDAQDGEPILNELRSDKERIESWSIIEDYCSVDPCDPRTDKPDNVIATAKKYRKINLTKVAISRGMDQQHYFFRRARAGVARFEPNNAIYTHRALANEVLGRDGYARRQGILEVMRHSAALTKELAIRFLSAGASGTAIYDLKNDRDNFLTTQFSTLIAFPHLTAEEQFDAIAVMHGDTILLDLLSCVRRATPDKVEQVLGLVHKSGDEHTQTAVLAAIHYSQSPLTPNAYAIVKGFLQSSIKCLRNEALAIAASTRDTSLLQEVVDSEWCAEKSRAHDSSFDDWHGSNAILQALQLGLIATEPALDRMNLSHYGFAAEILPSGQADVIATRIEAALVKALSFEGDIELPDIETGMPNVSDPSPSPISLSERVSSENDFFSQMNRLSEADEEFDERQLHMSETYKRFAAELTTAEADLILSDLSFEGINAIIGQDVECAHRWLVMLAGTSDRKLQNLHNFALQVAIKLVDNDNLLARDLIIRTLTLEPTIRRVTGNAKILAETIILWNNTDKLAVWEICKNRLNTPKTDSDIANEVLAAHLCGKIPILQTYIDELLTRKRPYDTALALMIAGFSDESPHAEAVLSHFEDAKGFVGVAHAAASNSYAKNAWAKTWYAEMQNAQRPEDFWRASILFMKIVDGRFDLWSKVSGEPSTTFTAFMPTVNREIISRAINAQKKRKKILFGEKAPASIMLNSMSF